MSSNHRLDCRLEGRVSPALPHFAHTPTLYQSNSGISLIEVVLGLIIVASLSIVASVKFGSVGEQTIAYQSDALANQIRHMQGLAMAWGVPLKMKVIATGYSVECVTAAATAPCNSTPIRDPAVALSFSATLQDGVSLSGTNFEIDSLGRPRDATTHTLLATTQTLTLTSGASKWNLTISPLTADIALTKI